MCTFMPQVAKIDAEMEIVWHCQSCISVLHRLVDPSHSCVESWGYLVAVALFSNSLVMRQLLTHAKPSVMLTARRKKIAAVQKDKSMALPFNQERS